MESARSANPGGIKMEFPNNLKKIAADLETKGPDHLQLIIFFRYLSKFVGKEFRKFEKGKNLGQFKSCLL